MSVDDVVAEAAPQFTPDLHPSGEPGQSRPAASCSGDATRIDDEVRIGFRKYAVHGVRFEYRDDSSGEPSPVPLGGLNPLQPGQRVSLIFREISDEPADPDQFTGGH
ncbi:hypothetical protein [Nocardia abscessus]|uniref:hypothetical protein n=1 Tax=Nocardia abscessus TaxID=120957 RepID=UPI0024581C70|nr:hypothetical protein [Nocardia abscessus]